MSKERRHRRAIPVPFRFRPRAGDDLLTGFARTDQDSGELRGFFATTLGISLLVWDLAFTLGAYRTIFYNRLMQIVVVSAVLLLGALVLRRNLTVRPWMIAILSIPIVWLIWRLITPVGGYFPEVYRVVEGVLVTLTMVSLPITLWVVLRILAPGYFALSTVRLRLAGLAIVLVVAAAGFLTGKFNYHVFTCEAFVVAGDDTPANCRPVKRQSSIHTPPPTHPEQVTD